MMQYVLYRLSVKKTVMQYVLYRLSVKEKGGITNVALMTKI